MTLDGQLALFDPPAAPPASERPRPSADTADTGRRAGQARAEAHAGPAWCDTAALALVRYLREHEFFHVDEFWTWAADRGLDEGPSPRALGPIIQREARAGRITRTRCTAPSVRSHNAHKPVWRSELYQGRRTHLFRGEPIR